jgi:hypothetical protein
VPEPVVHRTYGSCGTEWETPLLYAPPTVPRIEGGVRTTELFENFPSQDRKRSESELAKSQAHIAKVVDHSKRPNCGLSFYESVPPRPDAIG